MEEIELRKKEQIIIDQAVCWIDTRTITELFEY